MHGWFCIWYAKFAWFDWIGFAFDVIGWWSIFFYLNVLNVDWFFQEAHANPNLGAPGGWLPLHGAIYNDYDAGEICLFLCLECLFLWAQLFQIQVVALLLDAGARLDDGVDEIKGYAPLHIAIASEQVRIIFHLLFLIFFFCFFLIFFFFLGGREGGWI